MIERRADVGVAELALHVLDGNRRVLRERGLTDEQIEALLTRPKAPDNLN